jgi:hypothetical protein
VYTLATFALGYQSVMRREASSALAMLYILGAAGCGAAPGRGAQSHPNGWESRRTPSGTVWVDPHQTQQRFAAGSAGNATGTLADLGAKITVDTLLAHKAAKLIRAMPYPGCPGEAGLQAFTVSGSGGRRVLRIAYSNWGGNAVTAAYERPVAASDEPEAVEALSRAVCTAVVTATLPPLPR